MGSSPHHIAPQHAPPPPSPPHPRRAVSETRHKSNQIKPQYRHVPNCLRNAAQIKSNQAAVPPYTELSPKRGTNQIKSSRSAAMYRTVSETRHKSNQIKPQYRHIPAQIKSNQAAVPPCTELTFVT